MDLGRGAGASTASSSGRAPRTSAGARDTDLRRLPRLGGAGRLAGGGVHRRCRRGRAERRFARVFERMALPGLQRGARFDLLATLGRLGVLRAARRFAVPRRQRRGDDRRQAAARDRRPAAARPPCRRAGGGLRAAARGAGRRLLQLGARLAGSARDGAVAGARRRRLSRPPRRRSGSAEGPPATA